MDKKEKEVSFFETPREIQITIILHKAHWSDKLSGVDDYYTIKTKGCKEVNTDISGVINIINKLIKKMKKGKMIEKWCKHNQNIAGEYHRCYICNPLKEDRKWWNTEGFFEAGGSLSRDGDTDRTLEEIKHLFTIPRLKMIHITKKG